VSLILWQIAVIGEVGYRTDRLYNKVGLEVLVEVLGKQYGLDHEVVVYEASQYPVCEPIMDRVTLVDLPDARVSGISTLYVPPKVGSRLSQDMLRRLGIGAPEKERKEETRI
jgi:hypothetical protein